MKSEVSPVQTPNPIYVFWFDKKGLGLDDILLGL